MGFAILHMQKFNGGSLRGIQSHMDREKMPKSNPDVDFSRTKENYVLEGNADHLQARIKSRIEELHLKKAVRKDAVLCCGFMITASPESMKQMSKEQQRDYFRDSLEWVKKRYGAENVVYSVVHMDEATPHLHIGVIPVINGKLSAKALFNKTELGAIQSDFPKQVGAKYELQRGILGSERKHLSEMRFKAEMAAKEVEAITKQEEEIKKYHAETMKTVARQEEEARQRLADFEVAAAKQERQLQQKIDSMTKTAADRERKIKHQLAEMEAALDRRDGTLEEIDKIHNRGRNPAKLLGGADTSRVELNARDYLRLREIAQDGAKAIVLYKNTQEGLNASKNALQAEIKANKELTARVNEARTYFDVPKEMRPKVDRAIGREQRYWQAYAHDTHRLCLCVYRHTPGNVVDKMKAAGQAVKRYASNFRDVSDDRKLGAYVGEVVRASKLPYESRKAMPTLMDDWRMLPNYTDFRQPQQTKDVPLPQLVATAKQEEPEDWRYLSETEKKDKSVQFNR